MLNEYRVNRESEKNRNIQDLSYNQGDVGSIAIKFTILVCMVFFTSLIFSVALHGGHMKYIKAIEYSRSLSVYSNNSRIRRKLHNFRDVGMQSNSIKENVLS
uniref:Uncharacterized protein n=1 Tax=Rhizophagus irregularis (strain DAOM 181602 / DAOM 197198 / MUCL 43194) TaxID=747089 RepID=U9T8E2_RHIID